MAQSVPSTVRDRQRSGIERGRPAGWFTGLLWLQGVYYLATGVWPLVSVETFQMVTG